MGLALIMAIIAGSQSAVLAASARTSPLTMHEWSKAVESLPHSKAGCFTASYPAVEWRATRCKEGPRLPDEPANGTASHGPDTVGNGVDYAASISGLISADFGSFTNVSSGISEKGQFNGSGPEIANAYTVQLNTAPFSTAACDGTGNPNGTGSSGCQGWQQFVYSSHDNVLLMQYWLLQYDASCPSGWTPFQFTGSSAIYCYTDSPQVSYPGGGLTAGDLKNLSLAGFANADANDTVVLDNGGTLISVSNPDSFLGLAYSWNAAEFGVYGDYHGGEAVFSSGSSLEAQQQVNGSNVNVAPTCEKAGFTGETNNLNMTTTPAISDSPLYPSVASKQAVGATATASCATTGSPSALNAYGHIGYTADNSSDDLIQTATSDPLAWPSQEGRMDDQSSSDAPAITEFGNEFVMAYTSSSSSHDIYVSTSSNGVTWSAGTIVKGQTTDASPALADYNGKLVMAYIAGNGSNDVIVTTTTTPLAWSNNSYAIPQQSPSPPALAVYNGNLYMALRFNNGSNDIGVTETDNPNDWGTTGALVSGQSTGNSPALAVYNGELVMAYIAGNGSNDVFVTTATNPLDWANNGYVIPQQSPSAPSLFAWAGELDMGLRLNNGSNGIGVTVTTNPSNWGTSGTFVPDQKTSTTPVVF
jgi:hypothetical protein